MQAPAVKLSVAPLLLCLGLSGASAQVGSLPKIESSGSVVNQQLQSEKQLQIKPAPENVIIKPARPPLMAQLDGIKINLKKVSFTGDILLSEEALQAIAAPYLNKEVGLADLDQLCLAVSQTLQERDYAVVRTYLPQQDIVDGTVTIEIMVGRYGAVTVKNNSGINIAVVNAGASGMKPGEFIRMSTLERNTLLLNDLHGARAKSVLLAGSEVGTSDLNIEIEPSGKLAQFQLSYDNYGAYSVGSNQLGAAATFSNLTSLGDSLFVRANTGEVNGVSVNGNDGLLLGAINWQMPIGVHGGKINLGYSHMTYTLGRDFAGLGFQGLAKVASLSWIKPLIRTRAANLNLALGYDNANLTNSYPDPVGDTKQTVNRFNLGFNADNIDNSGANLLRMNWTNGTAKMHDPTSQLLSDDLTHTSGTYNKLSYSLMRQQRLLDRLALVLKFSGQRADKNLVAFEDMSLGGPYGVRAYGVGEATGDQGYIGTAELRWMLPSLENLQLIAFYDRASVTVNHQPWVAFQGVNKINLSGYGLGLSWNVENSYALNVSYAWRATDQLSTVGDDPKTNGRLWATASVSF